MDRPHILIIEDDASVCELLLSCLTKEGCRVSITHSGESGLSHIEEDPPELVVLDLNLPGMNGLDVCRAMRKDPWLGKIPVLMLTGQAEEDDVVAGLDVGADDYMAKPFSTRLLSARVNALLRRGGRSNGTDSHEKTPPEAKEKPEPLIIKTLGKPELTVSGRRFSWAEDFSPSQRQLLAMLVSSVEAKVPQDEVQVALWPDSPTAKARSSFDSLLSRVRKTLDEFLAPFESKKYLIVKRGYLCLENAKIDAHEFRRLAKKGNQQLSAGELWPAEITYSSAFSLWRGSFVPGDFGIESAIVFQDEMEQLYIETSMNFARLLAANKRYNEASKLLRDALRYNPTNDSVVRLMHSLCLAEEHPGQANQMLKAYNEALEREGFCKDEITKILNGFPKEFQIKDWLADFKR